MSHTITLVPASITALVNKNGIVSTTNEKAANLLRSASPRAIIAAAMGSKGAVGALARASVRSQVLTLDQLLQSDTIDGAQWGDLLALLVGEFGTAQFSRAQHAGKAGAVAYMAGVTAACEATVARAETVKAQTRAIESLQLAQATHDNVKRLVTAAENARIEAEHKDPVTQE